MKSTLAITSALAATILLGSCLDYEETLELEGDLSGRLTGSISLNELIAAAAGNDGEAAFSAARLEETVARLEGVTLEFTEEYTENGLRTLRYGLLFESLAHLGAPGSGASPEDDEFADFFGTITLEREEGRATFRRTVTFENARDEIDKETNEALDLLMETLLAGVLGRNHFTYTLRFPSTVFEANSEQIDADTNTVTWKFPLSKLATGPAEMRAVYKSPSGLGLVTWLLLAAGALVLLVGAITLIARLRPR
jgi:hypothetical protein